MFPTEVRRIFPSKRVPRRTLRTIRGGMPTTLHRRCQTRWTSIAKCMEGTGAKCIARNVLFTRTRAAKGTSGGRRHYERIHACVACSASPFRLALAASKVPYRSSGTGNSRRHRRHSDVCATPPARPDKEDLRRRAWDPVLPDITASAFYPSRKRGQSVSSGMAPDVYDFEQMKFKPSVKDPPLRPTTR